MNFKKIADTSFNMSYKERLVKIELSTIYHEVLLCTWRHGNGL